MAYKDSVSLDRIAYTTDRESTQMIRFYTVERLGENQSLTPEGFLYCSNVPIARTGSQMYAMGEIPVEPDRHGLIRIERPESEVFRPETIASFNGKPVVDEHPPEGKITPDMWKTKAVGTVLNPHRGDGIKFDNAFLYADLLIQDSDAIKAVRDGKREVSAGYDAEYQQLAPGHGQQRSIIGNHVALVDKGRCGPRCAIGDSTVASNRVKFFRDRIRKAVGIGDAEGVLNAVAELAKEPDLMGEVISGDDMPDMPDHAGGSHHVTINVHGGASGEKKTDDADEPVVADPAPAAPAGGGDLAAQVADLSARMDQIEQVIAMLSDEEEGEQPDDDDADAGPDESNNTAPEPDDDKKKFGDRATGDRRAVVGDSTSMRDSFQRMLSQAEILMPGIQLMTFDSARPAKTTNDAMCNFRRKTLEASKGTEKGKTALEAVLEGRLPKSFHDSSMTCDTVSAVFNAAANSIAVQNRGMASQPHFGPNGQRNGFTSGKAPTPAEINKSNAQAWAR